ncbi:MAG: hypothetical protein SFV17_19050 [Candidatus Obscuribacter sp.]|nr:hypothetical protein [Candidatus Obscuribacter sp.]
MTNIKTKAQNPEAVVFSTSGQIGYLFKAVEAGTMTIALPGQNPQLLDPEAIVQSYNPLEQRDLISITRGVYSNEEGIAHAAKELKGKRVLLADNKKSRVGTINHIEGNDTEGHKIFLAVEGSVAVINARDVIELEERPQDFFITVQTLDSGEFIFWLKDFVKVDVSYTLAAKRVRISATVCSIIDPEIIFTASTVMITDQDLSCVDDLEGLERYEIACGEVRLSPEQTGFNLYSAPLSKLEEITSLSFNGFFYKSGRQGIEFTKSRTFILTAREPENFSAALKNMRGRAAFEGKTYQVHNTEISQSDGLWLINTDSKQLTYGDSDWSARSDETAVPVLRNASESARLELVTYTDKLRKLTIYASKLGLEAGQTVLATGLPDSLNEICCNRSAIPVENGVARFSVDNSSSSVEFLNKESGISNTKWHTSYALIDDSGAIDYHSLSRLPAQILQDLAKTFLLRFNDSWQIYLRKTEPKRDLLQRLVHSETKYTNHLAVLRLVKSGQLDEIEEATEDLREPAEQLLEAIKSTVTEVWTA